jgi:Sulfotransferase family
LNTHRIFRARNLSIDRTLAYPELVDSFLCHMRDNAGKRIVGATVHRHFDRLLKIWPDARFIHLVRDGRDVALSCIRMGWAGNVWCGAARWLEAERLWDNLKSQLPEHDMIDVQYEKLVSNTDCELKRLCSFIGVSYSNEMLTYSSHSNYGSPDPAACQQWKKKLNRQELALIEARLGRILESRGYKLDSQQSLRVSTLRKSALELQSWFFRLRFRARRYGISLLASDILARRLNIKNWRVRTRLKMNQIDNVGLK